MVNGSIMNEVCVKSCSTALRCTPLTETGSCKSTNDLGCITIPKPILQPFYGSLDFVWDNPGESVPEETFTHSYLSWSSIIPYPLPPSFKIHSILQFACLTVFFHNLSPSFLWSTSWPGTLQYRAQNEKTQKCTQDPQ